MIFNILENTTELYITKYIIGEIFSSGGATLYKSPSDQTVIGKYFVYYLGILPDRVLLRQLIINMPFLFRHTRNT